MNETELILKFTPMVKKIAGRFVGSSQLDIDDLTQIGYIGILHAIRKYDPNLSDFPKIAATCIYNAIIKELPKNKKVQNLYSEPEVYDEINELIGLSDKELDVYALKRARFSNAKIAEKLGMSKSTVQKILEKIKGYINE